MANDSTEWVDTQAFGEGKALSADQLNRLTDSVSQRIMGDNKTVRVASLPGGQIMITALPQRRVTAAPRIWYVEERKEELPDPSTVKETALGRTTVFPLGGVFVINPAKDGWDALNYFE